MEGWTVFGALCVGYGIGFWTGHIFGQSAGIKWCMDHENEEE